MRLIAFALLFLCASPLHAAVVTYSYQGQPMYMPGVTPESCSATNCITRVLSGSISLDLKKVRGRSLANSTLSFVSTELGSGSGYLNSYKLISPKGTKSFESVTTFGNFPRSPLVSATGDVWIALGPIAYTGEVTLVFGADSEVVDWNMVGVEGGSSDWGSRSSGDADAQGLYSIGPGTWTRTIVDAPAPVPLPSSALALLAGIGVLVGARLRKRA